MPGESTVRMWVIREVEVGIRAQYAQARESLAECWAEESMEIADDGTNDWVERRRRDGSTETVLDREHVERSKLRVGQRNWMLARLLPRQYGDRAAVDVNLSVLTQEQRDARACLVADLAALARPEPLTIEGLVAAAEDAAEPSRGALTQQVRPPDQWE